MYESAVSFLGNSMNDFKIQEEPDLVLETYLDNFEDLQYLKEVNVPEYTRRVSTLTMNILDIDKYIKMNGLEKKEVTNPVFFTKGNQPTPDGLLSNEMFGITRADRAGTFGWIDLKGTYLDPSCYKQLCKLDKRFKSIVHHIDNFRVNEKGELVQDDEKGETGIPFIQKNINKIKFKKSNSVQRDLAIKYIEHNKKHMFITKYPVIAPYYRDVETSKGKTDVGAINKLYSAVISNVRASESTSDLGFFDNTGAIRGTIQEKLLQIYNWFVGNDNDASIEKGRGISGKLGILRMANASKTTDYSSRLVISSANLKTEYTNDLKINVDTCGIPLAVALANYQPFMLFNIKNFFLNQFHVMQDNPCIDPSTGETVYLTAKDPLVEFSDERIEEEMARFLHGYQDRFRPVLLHVEENDKTYAMKFTGRSSQGNIESESIHNRMLTWCDVFYMAAVESTKDKKVLITRYPIESAYNQVPNKIVVLSTTKTEPMYINDVYYPYYPVIKDEYIGIDSSNMFEDTLQLSNLLLQGINGDFDGDTTTIKSPYTEESNAELDALMNSKLNYIDFGATNIKTSSGDSIQAIYSLTKVLNDDETKIIAPQF